MCGAGSSRIAATARATSTDETGEVLPSPIGGASSSASRTRNAEVDARAAFDGAVHRGEIRQVALHDLGAEPTQGAGALVLSPDRGAYLVALGKQHCGEVATDGAAGSGHEHRVVACGFHHHVAGFTLRSEIRRRGDHRTSTVRRQRDNCAPYSGTM
jgi:hypothetical protein